MCTIIMCLANHKKKTSNFVNQPQDLKNTHCKRQSLLYVKKNCDLLLKKIYNSKIKGAIKVNLILNSFSTGNLKKVF